MFSKYNRYGKELNTHDLLKFAAITLMLIDHIGLYFFPEADWPRVFGRMCVPMWFFLIGYSNNYHISRELVFAGILVSASTLLVDSVPLPIDILLSIAIWRGFFSYRKKKNLPPESLIFVAIGALIWLLPLELFISYGTQGLLFAVCGREVRRGTQAQNKWFFVLTAAVFVIFESFMFKFSMLEGAVLAAGIAFVMWVLYNFELKKLGISPIYNIARFMGRYSLYIYVIHLLVIRIFIYALVHNPSI